MNITVHTDPACGASHATVHDELGQTVARFYGEDCVSNAQLYVNSFRARSALADLQATETRIETGNGRTTLAGNIRRLMAEAQR